MSISTAEDRNTLEKRLARARRRTLLPRMLATRPLPSAASEAPMRIAELEKMLERTRAAHGLTPWHELRMQILLAGTSNFTELEALIVAEQERDEQRRTSGLH